MRNDINATTTNDILARAIKARDRRDRDGKKRRPVTDGLIEYAVNALEANAAYAAKIADLEREIANERAKLAEIAEKVA